MRRGSEIRHFCAALAVGVVAIAILATSAPAAIVPPGFAVRKLPVPARNDDGVPYPQWINGLDRPTTLAFAPDGKMFVGEWLGRVKVFDSKEDATPTVAVNLTDQIHTSGDRGLLGMKLDPEFGTGGHNFIYLSYAYDALNGNQNAPIHGQYVDGGDKCEFKTPSDCTVSGRVARIHLNPATGVAVGGADDPPQHVLVQSWCQQYSSHSMGDIEFDSSGALLVSGGEGASFETADYGQFANPCGDPVDEGGSLRSQDVRTSGDQTDYSGSMVRIDPETGAALPDNPLFMDPQNPLVENPDVRARRILAYGFRNPYRFEIRPGTDDVYVGDVGQEKWEELNRLTSPPAPGQEALNFGWPCYEGGSGVLEVQPRWDILDKPLCESLYADPGQVKPSLWGYGHEGEGHLFDGDACEPGSGSAISGLAFYDPAGVTPNDVFPEQDQGALFMSDPTRGCVWVMRLGEDGEPDPSLLENFVTADPGPFVSLVDIVQGPDGALYGPDFYNNAVQEIRYYEPPVASLEASKDDGPIGTGFEVAFDAGASQDPKGGGLTYEWDLDGDGDFDDAPDSPTAHAEYEEAENVTISVRVEDVLEQVDTESVTIYPGDLGPPSPQILYPPEDLDWTVGDSIDYGGTATDPGGETVTSGALTLHWIFNVRHCPSGCHTHALDQAEGATGSFIAPPHEYPSHLRFELTATDSRDRSTTVFRDVFPKIVEVGVASEPTGAEVTVQGEPMSAGPFNFIAGTPVTVAAPPTAMIGGTEYSFEQWSDGGAATHQTVAFDSALLVARYRSTAAPPEPEKPQPPPAPSKSRVRLLSRPKGAKLSLDGTRRRAPFGAELTLGATARIVAPKSFHGHGRKLIFVGWRANGEKLDSGRRQQIVAGFAQRFLAVYKLRR